MDTGNTESVFAQTIALCFVAALLCGMLLDAGYISSWAHYFFVPYAGYLTVRIVAWNIKGKFPELTNNQKIFVFLSPFIGFLLVFGVLFAKRFI